MIIVLALAQDPLDYGPQLDHRLGHQVTALPVGDLLLLDGLCALVKSASKPSMILLLNDRMPIRDWCNVVPCHNVVLNVERRAKKIKTPRDVPPGASFDERIPFCGVRVVTCCTLE